MRRWRGRRGGARRRSVAWVPGITAFDTATPSQTRLVTLTNVSTALYQHVFGAAIGVTTSSDLGLHGGEDAVLTRIRGRLGFTTGRIDSGAGAAAATFLLRVSIVQADTVTTGAGDSTMPFEFLSSAGLGQDDILWTNDVIVPGTSILETAGASVPLGTAMSYVLDIDCKAQRKLQVDRQAFLWFQTALDNVTVTTADFRLWGGLRVLLKRPR